MDLWGAWQYTDHRVPEVTATWADDLPVCQDHELCEHSRPRPELLHVPQARAPPTEWVPSSSALGHRPLSCRVPVTTAWWPNWNPHELPQVSLPPFPKGSLTMLGFSLQAPPPGLELTGRLPWAAGTQSSSQKPTSRHLPNNPEAAHAGPPLATWADQQTHLSPSSV